MNWSAGSRSLVPLTMARYVTSDWLATGHCRATGVLAAELSRVDGSGVELTVTAFPHSVLHLSLDSLL